MKYTELPDTTALARAIGAEIERERRRKCLGRADLAELAGVSERALRYVEKQTAGQVMMTVLRALDALELDYSEFFGKCVERAAREVKQRADQDEATI